jgi:hypothetical protein
MTDHMLKASSGKAPEVAATGLSWTWWDLIHDPGPPSLNPARRERVSSHPAGRESVEAAATIGRPG